MNWSALHGRKFLLGIAYFVVASLALTLTRYEGGVAFLWGATCAADRRPAARTARAWVYSVVPCVIASVRRDRAVRAGLGMAALPFMRHQR